MNADDVLTLADAAKLCERSTSTIRRWIKRGDLPATKGHPAKAGGRAPYLIRTGDLMQMVSDLGVQPQQSPNLQKTPEATAASSVTTAMEDIADPFAGAQADYERYAIKSPTTQLMEIRFEIEHVKLTHQADTARLRLAHALEQLNESKRETATVREEGHLYRLERDDWRDRHDALAAELKAMRQATGNSRSWWQRLLGGPAELPDYEN